MSIILRNFKVALREPAIAADIIIWYLRHDFYISKKQLEKMENLCLVCIRICILALVMIFKL